MFQFRIKIKKIILACLRSHYKFIIPVFSNADFVSYGGATGPVVANLTTGTATGQGTDNLIGIEDIEGGSGNDSLTGNTSVNFLSGLDGDDFLLGLDGDDFLNGGGGNDFLGRGLAIIP